MATIVVNENILRREILQLLNKINAQIEEVEMETKRMGIEPHQLRDSAGNWVMVPLLAAKTQAYTSLITLQTTKK